MELLTSYQTMEWLQDIVTGDEKSVVYVNRSGETGSPKLMNDLHPKKVMLSVWWNITSRRALGTASNG